MKVYYSKYDATKHPWYTHDDWVSMGLGLGIVVGMITAILLKIYL